MFRNVYWHHAVRAATVLYKRVVGDALQHRLMTGEELVGATDEGIMYLLESRAAHHAGDVPRTLAAGLAALRARRLPKRAAELAAADLPDGAAGEWLVADTSLKRRAEEAVAAELGLAAGAVFLDYPEKSLMFGLDLLVRRRSGEVLRLGPEGRAGLIGLPEIAAELYRTARVLRLFTFGERRDIEPALLAALAARSAQEMEEELQAGRPLLA